jgi:hypothetical protein
MLGESIIKSPSKELLKEIIKNPLEPFVNVYIDFLADGVKIPQQKENYSKYIKLCDKKNIAPFSGKNINYGDKVKETIPKHLEGAKRFFGEGRTNWISIQSSGDELKILNDVYIPSLLENNYELDWGTLSFGDHKVGSHHTEGIESHLSISIGKKNLELRIDRNYVKKEREIKFKNWIQDLEKKYTSK